MKRCLACLAGVWLFVAAQADVGVEVDAVYAQAEALYLDLHRHPELSFQEHRTAAKLATGLREIGYVVETGVGRTGVVGLLKNGPGPVVMLRTELDALPVEEKTGLPYSSTVQAQDGAGKKFGVMHACGHDAHMAAWLATAKIMATERARWSGTLMLVAQPAEELGEGANAMLGDGLFTRFARPDYALAVHLDPRYSAGTIGYRAGPIMSNIDTVAITIFGRGGHGARPEVAIDPIVIAARTVLTLQTLVSREISPFDPAVVTIGSLHGGTKSNIIPDEARLEISVRSLTETVREKLLSGIERIARAEAVAAASPAVPRVEFSGRGYALVNDERITKQVATALVRELGNEHVNEIGPEMVSEDFSNYHKADVPILMLRIGTGSAVSRGETLPSLHSAFFAPDRKPTLTAAIAAEVIALRELMSVRPLAEAVHQVPDDNNNR